MSTPAGWYPDPSRRGRVRFWDGARWTSQYRPAVASTTVYAPPQTLPAVPNPGSVGGFVCSLIGVLFVALPIVCIPLTIVGIVLSSRRLRHVPFGTGRGITLWGLWLGIVGLAITVVIMVAAIPGAIQANF
ncbi:DUF2510 domain-containing protein [Humibacter sp. RRB41]|uniref:DUF2510 domain-containing protein n=1 Tax=Humibacter sp. RRB41 TaxID=2919946 RepID=UPI001FA97E69|nr:DUF2510 domain-containing protein [Humibacter sp. RRB41]